VDGWVVGRRSWLFYFVLGLSRSREFSRVPNFSRVFIISIIIVILSEVYFCFVGCEGNLEGKKRSLLLKVL